MATRIYWVNPPSQLSRNLDLYGRKLVAAVIAIAEFIATKMQNEARQNAKWQDRTGNARSGIFAVVERNDLSLGAAEMIVSIYLSHGHTVDYGKWLELANGGKYAIIVPTIEANLPTIRRMLRELFR